MWYTLIQDKELSYGTFASLLPPLRLQYSAPGEQNSVGMMPESSGSAERVLDLREGRGENERHQRGDEKSVANENLSIYGLDDNMSTMTTTACTCQCNRNNVHQAELSATYQKLKNSFPSIIITKTFLEKITMSMTRSPLKILLGKQNFHS